MSTKKRTHKEFSTDNGQLKETILIRLATNKIVFIWSSTASSFSFVLYLFYNTWIADIFELRCNNINSKDKTQTLKFNRTD